MTPGMKTTARDREAVVVGVMGVFGELGVTAEDLRQWAPWCAALGELADAMDNAANHEKRPAEAFPHPGRPDPSPCMEGPGSCLR